MTIKLTMTQLQRGPTSKLIISVVTTNVGEDIITDPIPVGNLALVRFKFDHVLRDQYTLDPSVSLKRGPDAPVDSTVQVKIMCDRFRRDWICGDNWIDYVRMRPKVRDVYVEVAYTKVCSYVLEIDISVHDVTSFTPYDNLYGQMDTADFRITARAGSVRIHKAVLAAHSDKFKTSLTFASLENSLASTPMQTLHDLRSYVYLGQLPEDGLEPLLLVARECEMKRLVSDCITKLAENVRPNNLDALIRFASKHNIPELVWAIIYFTSSSVLGKARQRHN